MPPRKRACFTTPAPGCEIRESSAAGAARQPGPTPEADTWDEIVEAMMEIAPTTLEGVDQRVTELDTTVRQRTEEFQVRFEEAYDVHASCMVSYKDDLYKLLFVQVMAASTIPVSAEENLGDPIDIRVDIIHPEPVAAVAFPAAAIVRTQAQHGEAIRGIQEHLLGVPIQEELTALRFRADIAEAENASLRARIKTTEAIGKITRNRERQARVKIEQQLAAVQESQRQDREDFRKLKELMTSQFGRHS
ncbi:hypothetical protein Tco_0319051 [Tanacetum coccineum]